MVTWSERVELSPGTLEHLWSLRAAFTGAGSPSCLTVNFPLSGGGKVLLPLHAAPIMRSYFSLLWFLIAPACISSESPIFRLGSREKAVIICLGEYMISQGESYTFVLVSMIISFGALNCLYFILVDKKVSQLK